MDPRKNPYAPGAGTPPPELAGRDDLIERAAIALDRIRESRAARSRTSLGITSLNLEIGNPARPKVTEKINLLVDSGAIYSVVPEPILQRLRIRPLATEEFRLADGSTIQRRKGIALFRYGKRIGGADVIFGEPDDSHLLGALTLEALGLSLDPIRRELKPLPMILGGWRAENGPRRRRRTAS